MRNKEIARTGAMGTHLAPHLADHGYNVDVISSDPKVLPDPRDHYSSPSISGCEQAQEILTAKHYDAFVDYLKYTIPEFKKRHRIYLENTGHYIFLPNPQRSGGAHEGDLCAPARFQHGQGSPRRRTYGVFFIQSAQGGHPAQQRLYEFSTVICGAERANITGDPYVGVNSPSINPPVIFPRTSGYSNTGIVVEDAEKM